MHVYLEMHKKCLSFLSFPNFFSSLSVAESLFPSFFNSYGFAPSSHWVQNIYQQTYFFLKKLNFNKEEKVANYEHNSAGV